MTTANPSTPEVTRADVRLEDEWHALSARADQDTGNEGEDMAALGIRDGYEQAIQTLDVLTGGDGEFRYCTVPDDSHCPDPPAMIRRIVARLAHSQDGSDPADEDEIAFKRKTAQQTRDFVAARSAPVSTTPARGGDELREAGERYRHLKRGTVYEVVGIAELQAMQLQGDHAELVIYRGEDGKLWARNSAEFHDGRFERVASTDMAGAGKGLDRATLKHCALTIRDRAVTISAAPLGGGKVSEASKIAARHLISAAETIEKEMLAAPPVEGLTSGEGDRYANGYAQGQADAEQQHRWMQDKAWQDAVLMLVHYQTLAERTWLVGHEEAAAKLAEWWKRAKALAYTKSVEEIAASPKATATASVREWAALAGHVRGIATVIRAFPNDKAWGGVDQAGEAAQILDRAATALTLPVSGTADTHAGSLREAADYLDQYAQFIRDEVRAADLERHPYLPALEQAASDLRALHHVDSRAQGGEK